MAMTKSKIKEDFAYGKVDILYRKFVKGKPGGWRSFKKAIKNKNPPWPWEMSNTEWKLKKLSK